MAQPDQPPKEIEKPIEKTRDIEKEVVLSEEEINMARERAKAACCRLRQRFKEKGLGPSCEEIEKNRNKEVKSNDDWYPTESQKLDMDTYNLSTLNAIPVLQIFKALGIKLDEKLIKEAPWLEDGEKSELFKGANLLFSKGITLKNVKTDYANLRSVLDMIKNPIKLQAIIKHNGDVVEAFQETL
ncbi:MAG: hypothetical protein WCT36_01860 [Candidatus Gracilibacteria bacterium]